ncbi:MAG: tRNA pseudouridine(38-40) synthase TruA [Oscillospiraceae bacterium]|nr:tRNA pseudouridine(38-40) synthase TruA [Oscillospiraceae bacterium]
MSVYRLELCYDGSRYKGWQKQGNTSPTIQEKLETALSRILGASIECAGSGRTDAGVHARRQVASFHAAPLDCGAVLAALRTHLPEDIGALSLTEAPPRFHARLSCRKKTYLYRIWRSDEPCVFVRKYVWRHEGALDAAKMEKAAAALCGKHDFAAFSTGHTKKSTVRTVESIRIEEEGPELRLYFTGDGFLYNMVRILTGTLVEVGKGKRSAADMADILTSLDRKNAGPTAPAQGLTLWDVEY